MNNTEISYLNRIKDNLSSIDFDNTIVYQHQDILMPGVYNIGEVHFDVPWKFILAFIDLEPMFNWGHACYYIALEDKGSGIIINEAQFPPGLNSNDLKLNVIWIGKNAPEWAIMS